MIIMHAMPKHIFFGVCAPRPPPLSLSLSLSHTSLECSAIAVDKMLDDSKPVAWFVNTAV